MYNFILLIQVFSIIILLTECWVVFINWKSMIHSYLFMGCISTLVTNIGYLLQLMSRTEETYLTALRMAYIGKVWTAFALFLFITELVKIWIPLAVKIILAQFNVITYIIVFTTKRTGLYYKNISFSMIGRFPVLIHENGPWHYLFDTMVILYILYGVKALLMDYQKETEPVARKRILMVILTVITESTFLIIKMFCS